MCADRVLLMLKNNIHYLLLWRQFSNHHKKIKLKTITNVWIIPCCRHLFNIYYYRQTISLLTIVNTELVQPTHSERWSQLSLILLLLVFSVWLQGLKFSWKVLWITAGIKNFSQENARNAAVGVAAHNL